MIFLDASAIVAVLAREPDAAELAARMAGRRPIYASAIVAYEAVLGLARAASLSLADARQMVTALLVELSAEIVPITAERGSLAIAAFERYGKGRHPAALTMGDCFSYACARDLDVPLLYKGEDFARTDIRAA